MNCPSRTDDTLGHVDWNQSPPTFAADTTTRQDLNGIANSRVRRDDERVLGSEPPGDGISAAGMSDEPTKPESDGTQLKPVVVTADAPAQPGGSDHDGGHSASNSAGCGQQAGNMIRHIGRVLKKYTKFIGPGFLVAVAYIDPGNYSTDVSAGATYRFKLLFIVLMSNLFAIFLQSLCIKLGTVTGMNLAEHCKASFPGWLNIILYIFAESAIIATDIAEVIGSAIALNLLFHIPLVAGCAITLVDVLVILIFYRPTGSFRGIRYFELFVVAMVLGVVVCFCIELSYIENTTVSEVFRGYLPSSAIVETDGLYMSCGILGATVMPHSLYLGSGVVQSRVRHYDIKHGHISPTPPDSADLQKYRPSFAAIKYCLSYSITELAISLFSFALFVNSAILIVAGASLSNNDGAHSADLFGIYGLLSESLAPVAGTLFALALLLSGTSAGIVCTIAGQMVSEGQLNWTIAPWMRRLITRAISITPSIIIAAAVGKDGLSAALNGTQVALSVILPFVSAPLIYFTCSNRYMTVVVSDVEVIGMRNHWATTAVGVAIWLVIVVMNGALLVLKGMGKA